MMNSSSNRLLSDSNTAAILHMMANVYKRDNIFTDKSIKMYYSIILITIIYLILYVLLYPAIYTLFFREHA